MPKILIIAEQEGGQLKRATLSSVTFAREELAKAGGGSFAFLVIGKGVGAAADALQGYGAESVFVADAASVESYLAETYSVVASQVASQFGADTVVATATSFGKDLLPRVAARLKAGMASDITLVKGHHVYQRPMWAGNVLSDVKVKTPVAVVSVRAAAFAQAVDPSGSTPVSAVSVEVPKAKTRFVSFQKTVGTRPELTEARVVVSGGRGVKSKDNFKVIENLADSLRAAIGASRAAVDSGYAPNDYQVGQTGKVVAPELYIAVAISGAIQHWAGMSGSKVIVAINKDADAPIMQQADYALVADLFQAVPELISELQKG
jgi:electron transfer flavoprotein alpha subunit